MPVCARRIHGIALLCFIVNVQGGVVMAENEQVLFETLQNMPYSLEAEQSVLGALLLEPDQIGAVLEQLPRPEMFYRKQHRELFGVLCGMFSLNKTIDFVTVLDEAVRAAVFDSAENAKLYLVQLMELVPTTANLMDYCRIVREKYYLRALITACGDIIERPAAARPRPNRCSNMRSSGFTTSGRERIPHRLRGLILLF